MRKLLTDLLPVLLFFLVYKLASGAPDAAAAFAQSTFGGLISGGRVPPDQAPIIVATAVAIVVSLAQVVWLLARGRRVEPMLWISVAIIVVFGGATIWLHDETFIKWKPTILYLVFGGTLAGARLAAGRNLLRTLLGAQIRLPGPVWERLLWAWAGFFFALAALNLTVAYTMSTDAWVNFKLFGLMGLTFAFTLANGVWLARHIEEPASPRPAGTPPETPHDLPNDRTGR